MVYVDPNEVMEFTTDNEYWIDRVLADAKKHPDEIRVLLTPEENKGSIKVLIPYKYMGVRPDQIIYEEVTYPNEEEIVYGRTVEDPGQIPRLL